MEQSRREESRKTASALTSTTTSEIPASAAPLRRQLSLFPLITATFFMVSGGPYGLEELIQKSGFRDSLLILFFVPFLWSLPTALMLGELSAAIPAEGGFYVWVTRALGPFWGFQEAWLSLAASVFDMAIYPTLFVLYLSRIWPWAGKEHHGIYIGAAMIVLCALWNLCGAKVVGDSSLWMTILLLAPFGVLAVWSLVRGQLPEVGAVPATAGPTDVMGGVLIAMWNYMGWDNASTIAGEVEEPQRTYPRAMLGAVLLVAASYVITVACVARTGIDASQWETGAWVEAASAIATPWLGWCIVVGGMLCGLGMFNALVLSYSRLPAVLAEDGFLPKVFAKRLESNGAPWVAVIALSILWTASLGLSFERLVMIDVLVYGASLVLEFIALAVLRHKEPELVRPFRVPGGTVGAWLLGVAPTVLIVVAFVRNRTEMMDLGKFGQVTSLNVGLIIMVLGVVYYGASKLWRKTTAV